MRGERKKTLPLAGAKRYGHRSHVRTAHLYRNKTFKDWLERDLQRLKRLYERGEVEC